ncbi:unnamed protein product [Cochlearia groenlandica]
MSSYLISPSPLYARNLAYGQNLVESTKIERQVVASRKTHRKENKEKKKKQKFEKSLQVQYFSSAKHVSDESEQLEKSCLTEEHEQHVHVCYLSDGSKTSKKRRLETYPVVDSILKGLSGNPLRIRFVFNKPKEPESVSQEDRVCSTSGTEQWPRDESSSVSGLKNCDCDENLLSPSLESDKIAIPSESKKRKKHKMCKESRYNTLFDQLVPSCNSSEESNTDDWLSGTWRQESSSTKASSSYNEGTAMNMQNSGDYTLPGSQFLSEVGIFSLPYTVAL